MGTERIETRGADGRQVWVIKTTSRLSSRDLSGRVKYFDGLSSFTLADGQAVNETNDGFRVVATDERLERV